MSEGSIIIGPCTVNLSAVGRHILEKDGIISVTSNTALWTAKFDTGRECWLCHVTRLK